MSGGTPAAPVGSTVRVKGFVLVGALEGPWQKGEFWSFLGSPQTGFAKCQQWGWGRSSLAVTQPQNPAHLATHNTARVGVSVGYLRGFCIQDVTQSCIGLVMPARFPHGC